MKPKIKATTRQDELMYAFDFTESDLELNREGQLAEKQGQMAIRHISFQWVALGIPIIGVFGIFFLMSIPDIEAMITPFSFVLFGLGFIVPSIYQWMLTRSDINAGRVEVIQGITVVDTDSHGSQSLSIGNLQLKANRHALLRIKHLEPHIVYFLPRSKIIVSVEVVE